jgi:hypothetical protein
MKSNGTVPEVRDGLELKYCERCGGLWLRPVGGVQIYCSVCARAMADLPPSSRNAEVSVSRPRRVHEEITSTDFDGRMA